MKKTGAERSACCKAMGFANLASGKGIYKARKPNPEKRRLWDGNTLGIRERS